MSIVDVTIVICAKNYEQFISEAIESCVNQLPSGLSTEIICVDDGSEDSTLKIMQRYSENLRALQTTSVGIEKAFNTALEAANGTYIVRVDADDALEPDYLLKLQKYSIERADIIYGDYSVINQQSEITHRIRLPDFDQSEVLGRGDFLATGTAIRRDVFKRLKMYNENVKNCGLENYELICRAILAGMKLQHVREDLFKYRIHNVNMSKQRREAILRYGERLFLNLNLDAYDTGPLHPYFGNWK